MTSSLGAVRLAHGLSGSPLKSKRDEAVPMGKLAVGTGPIK
ncbi:hypothetical protein [Corallococcus soli]|nr:hypothetical protein [Corallococcus soli]